VSKLSQSERTALSDKRMIDTAVRIILERGIGGLRLTQVGLKAGYSRGLAAMRFGTMGGLLRRVAEQLGQRWIDSLNKALIGKRGLGAIYAAIDTQESWLTKSSQVILGQYLIFFHSLDPGSAERLNAVRVVVAQRRDLSRWIRDAMAAGQVDVEVDPEAEAASILSSMIGIIFQALMDPNVSARKLCVKLKIDIAARLALPQRTRAKSALATATMRQRLDAD
jgi:AcrR family transcriptional regulator